MTPIRELIHVPERVHQGDFVLKLSEGVEHAGETLGNYVVGSGKSHFMAVLSLLLNGNVQARSIPQLARRAAQRLDGGP